MSLIYKSTYKSTFLYNVSTDMCAMYRQQRRRSCRWLGARGGSGITGVARGGAAGRAPRAPVTPAYSVSRPEDAPGNLALLHFRLDCSPPNLNMSPSCLSYHHCASLHVLQDDLTS